MKHIAYITPDFPPSSTAVSVRTSFFVDAIKKEGNNVVVFTSVSNSKYNIQTNYFTLPSNKDNHFFRIIKEFLYGIELFFRIILYKKMDIYIITSPPYFITIFAFLASRIKNKKNIILDVRDLYPEVFFQSGLLKNNGFFGKILKKIEFWMYEKSLNVITVTEGLQDKISKQGIIPAKITLIKNGFDSNIFKSSTSKYSRFTIVFHGTVGKFQNIELLLKIIKIMRIKDKGIKFIIVGKGSKDYILQNAKQTNMEYIEHIDYKNISKIISQCHLGLSLRMDDDLSKLSLPVKVFEYIGVGIPVVITPISEAGELVKHENFGIACNNDINEVLFAIEAIRNNYQMYIENISKRSYYFSRQYESYKVIKIIQNIL